MIIARILRHLYNASAILGDNDVFYRFWRLEVRDKEQHTHNYGHRKSIYALY